MKDFKLPKIKTGFSPKQVANQKFGTLKDVKGMKHTNGIGFSKIKNPLAK